MLADWIDFVVKLLERRPDHVTSRLDVHKGVEFKIWGRDFFDSTLTWDKLMFLGKSNKPKGLERHYLNQASIDAARKELEFRISKRRQGTVAIDFKGKPKTWGFTEHTSHCMLAATIMYADKECFITVFYRSSDVIKALPADLIFLRDRIFSQFDFSKAPVAYVRIIFASIYVDPLLVTLIAGYRDDWQRIFHSISRLNPNLFKRSMYWGWRLLCDPKKKAHEYELTERYYRYLVKLTTPETRRMLKVYIERSRLK